MGDWDREHKGERQERYEPKPFQRIPFRFAGIAWQ